MDCWADISGDCAGGQSHEHYISKCLWNTDIIGVAGFNWTGGKGRKIPLATATANILCKHHNEMFSVVDNQALQWKAALIKFFQGSDVTKGDQMWLGPPRIELCGPLFTRWITKTYCNIAAIDKKPRNNDFVRYALGERTNREIHFYIFCELDALYAISDDRIVCTDYYDKGQMGILFHVNFFGFHCFASNLLLAPDEPVPITNKDGSQDMLAPRALMKSPRELVMCQPIGMGQSVPVRTIVIKW